jgi:hypothetical protein
VITLLFSCPHRRTGHCCHRCRPCPPPPLPLPPLLSSCLAPLASSYCRCHRFRCSLLIVVCPHHCHCRRLCRLCRRCRLCLAIPLPEVINMIVFVVNVVVVIVVVVPVAIVDNDVMPGLRRSLCRRSLLSLLSQCFLVGVSAAQRRPLFPPSMWPLLSLSMRSLFPRLLPLTSRHGHDLLLRKSLF